MTSKEVTVREPQEVFALPEIDSLRIKLDEVRKFQATVKQLLIEGHDYGVIPGTEKPSLLKPGAEKIDKILNLADTYEEMDKIEDWQKPLFYYKVKCQLKIIGTDIVISEGMGSCNSMESRYRYRWAFGSELPEYIDKSTLVQQKRHSKKTARDYIMYRMENEDIYTQANTILKMAKKRAHIDASLSAGRLSDVFTQDLEHIMETVTPVREAKEERVAKAEPAKEPEPAPEALESISKAPEEQTNAKPQPDRDPDTIKTITELQKALWHDFKLQPKEQLAELNLNNWADLAISPSEAYRQIASIRK